MTLEELMELYSVDISSHKGLVKIVVANDKKPLCYVGRGKTLSSALANLIKKLE